MEDRPLMVTSWIVDYFPHHLHEHAFAQRQRGSEKGCRTPKGKIVTVDRNSDSDSLILMSALQESGSGFADVVIIPEHMASWPKLGISHPLAQLHAKFWGKSMADEEEEWRKSRPPVLAIGNKPGGKDQDGDQHMNENSDETVDEGQITDLDGDIIPGCYLLDIGIEDIYMRKIWIRAEYQRVYDFLEIYYQTPAIPYDQAPAVVLTGQPGIGKSVWIYYALRRRLGERKPVIWYRGAICYLFVEEGVYEMSKDFQRAQFKTITWTFVDSDESQEGVPPYLVPQGTRLFVTYATSPRQERWSRLHKTVRSVRVIMNPWTRAEIFQLALALQPESIEHSQINHAFDELGPTPRLCIDISSNPEALYKYKDAVQMTISTVKSRQLKRLLEEARTLTIDAVSHKICLVSRENRDEVYSPIVIAPITPSIQSRLANQLRRLEKGDKLHLYDHFARVPESRATAGIYFEALVQGHFQEKINLELIPMVKLDKARKGDMPQWYSSHILLSNPELEASRQQALLCGININTTPAQTQEFSDDGPSRIDQDVLYIPEAGNQEALDSFILLDSLLIFQFTTSTTDKIKRGLLRFFERYPDLPPKSQWRFVFITPPNLAMTCPQPWDLNLREVPLFSAVIVPADCK